MHIYKLQMSKNPQDKERQISEQTAVSGQHLCPVVTERNEKREEGKAGDRRKEEERENADGWKKWGKKREGKEGVEKKAKEQM